MLWMLLLRLNPKYVFLLELVLYDVPCFLELES